MLRLSLLLVACAPWLSGSWSVVAPSMVSRQAIFASTLLASRAPPAMQLWAGACGMDGAQTCPGSGHVAAGHLERPPENACRPQTCRTFDLFDTFALEPLEKEPKAES